jgi:PAS domain S-box-containing protein
MALQRPKLTTTVILLIMLPMLVQWGFLWALHEQLSKAEVDYRTQDQYVQLLDAVNKMMIEYTMVVTSSDFFERTRQHRFAVEQGVTLLGVMESFEAIDRICQQSDNPTVTSFQKIWKRLQQMLVAYEQPNTLPDYDKLSEIRKVIVSAVTRLTNSEMETGERLAARRREMDQILVIGAITDFGVIILLTVWFSLTLGRRLNHLVVNTRKLTMGEPLLKPLIGGDELAKIDAAMHRLADEMAIVRKQDRALIDNTAEVIFSADSALRVTQVNGAVTKRLGYEPEEFAGTLFTRYIAEPDRLAVYQKLTEVIAQRSEVAFECEMIDSFNFPHATEITAQWSQAESNVFCVARDITARKEAERVKQEVLAMVSHDLRAPLTSLKLTLSMIGAKFKSAGDESGTEAVSVARHSVASLYNLTSDLLDLESYEAVGIHLDCEETDIAELVAQSIKIVAADTGSRGLKMTATGETLLAEIDAVKVSRIIVNLLHNAIKFSPEGKTVTISWGLVPNALPAAVEIRVSDQGPGIQEDKQTLVFEKYRQAGTGSEGERIGTGLGLAICKAIVEAHHGTIGVMSRMGEGSTFWFKLPVHQPAAKES